MIDRTSVEVTQEEVDALPEYERIQTVATMRTKLGDKPISARALRLFASLAVVLGLDIETEFDAMTIRRKKSDDELRHRAKELKWSRLYVEERERAKAAAAWAAHETGPVPF